MDSVEDLVDGTVFQCQNNPDF